MSIVWPNFILPSLSIPPSCHHLPSFCVVLSTFPGDDTPRTLLFISIFCSASSLVFASQQQLPAVVERESWLRLEAVNPANPSFSITRMVSKVQVCAHSGFPPMNSLHLRTSAGTTPSCFWGIFSAMHCAKRTAVLGSMKSGTPKST